MDHCNRETDTDLRRITVTTLLLRSSSISSESSDPFGTVLKEKKMVIYIWILGSKM